MVYIDNQIITLNSKDATKLNGTYLSNVVFPFRGLLKDEPQTLRSYIKVSNAQFPVSFYTIDATNNILSYASGSTHTITIPIGNYNATTLISAMIVLFTANGDAITPSFNSNNGKMTFTSAVSYNYYPYGTNNCTIGNILGIGPTTLSGTVAVCPYPLNLLNKKKLFINSANLFNVAYSSYKLGFTTTIATIPVNQPPYNLINYVSLSDTDKNIITNKHLDSIDIQILDENNNFINFNSIDWSISLCLSCEKTDPNRQYIDNFNSFLKPDETLALPQAEPHKQVIEPLTQDEKDLELLQN